MAARYRDSRPYLAPPTLAPPPSIDSGPMSSQPVGITRVRARDRPAVTKS
jgi:hypothetical protein